MLSARVTDSTTIVHASVMPSMTMTKRTKQSENSISAALRPGRCLGGAIREIKSHLLAGNGVSEHLYLAGDRVIAEWDTNDSQRRASPASIAGGDSGQVRRTASIREAALSQMPH
jgi:hypothetical protein